MSHDSFTSLSLDALADVTGGTCQGCRAKSNVAQNAGAAHVDPTYGWGYSSWNGKQSEYAIPRGHAGRSALPRGSALNVYDRSGKFPL